MYPFPTLSHDQLLTLAYKTQGAARDHDRRRLEAEVVELLVRADGPDAEQAVSAIADLVARKFGES